MRDIRRRTRRKCSRDFGASRASASSAAAAKTSPSTCSTAGLETSSKRARSCWPGGTVREAASDGVKEVRSENRELEEVVAEILLKNRGAQENLTGPCEEDAT